MLFGVAWTVNVVQPSYMVSSLIEAISLQFTLNLQRKSKTEILPLPCEIFGEYITRYRPPGTMKSRQVRGSLPIEWSKRYLVVRGCRTAPGSLRSPFSSLRQNSIHLRGPIAAISSSKSPISDMGKLGRKRALSIHIRKSAASQTTRRRVQRSRALQVLIILQWFDQQ